MPEPKGDPCSDRIQIRERGTTTNSADSTPPPHDDTSRQSPRRQVSGTRRALFAALDSVTVANLTLLAATLTTLILTSRFLGVNDRGLYVAWGAWSSLVGTLALLAAPQAIVLIGRGYRPVSMWQFHRLLALGILASTVAAALAMTLLGAGTTPMLGGVLLASSGPVTATAAAIQQANGTTDWRFNLARLSGPIVGFLLVITTIFLWEPDVQTLFLLLGIGNISGAVAGLLGTAAKGARDTELSWIVSQRAMLLTPLVLGNWLVLRGDLAIVSAVGSNSDVALYGVGVGARSVVLAAGTSIGLRWFASRASLGGVKGLARRFMPALAIALAITVSAPWAVPLALGDAFSGSVPIVQVMAPTGLALAAEFLQSHRILVHFPHYSMAAMKFIQYALLWLGFLLVHGDPVACALILCGATMISVVVQESVLRSRQHHVA